MKNRLVLLIILIVDTVAMFVFAVSFWYLKETSTLLRISGFLVLVFNMFAFILFYYSAIYEPRRRNAELIRRLSEIQNEEEFLKLQRELTGLTAEIANKIIALFQKQFKIEESKRQTEYLALQSQINPHFLYNTLEAIRGDAIVAGMNTVSDMTEALATFFRYTISGGKTIVTLEDELSNVENYFLIQQYRFGDRLSYSVRNPDNILDSSLPKLTLQPIIENAIYHGIECKLGSGRIDIIIEATKSRLIIDVIDDGVGMEECILSKLNKAMDTHFSEDSNGNNREGEDLGSGESGEREITHSRSGIGLINVNNRIKLIFGNDYGLRVSSTPGVGTDVEITLPLK